MTNLPGYFIILTSEKLVILFSNSKTLAYEGKKNGLCCIPSSVYILLELELLYVAGVCAFVCCTNLTMLHT